ncbi:MAG: AMP-binding protein [Nanoarchaeota archaeon]|nr:AMP-binding protein [Nanoarchaeota archaeon]
MNIVDLISFRGGIAFLERKGYRTYPTTYKELKQRMLKTETYLIKNKVKKGDRVLIQATNCVDYVVLMLACLRLGVVVVPLDFHTSKQLRKKIIKETEPKLVFTNLDSLEKLTKDLKQNKSVPAISKDDVAEIIYTSGTTGVPKGVVLTHGNICSNVESLKKGFRLKLRHISVLPLSHMMEQCSGLFLPLSNNSLILYPNSLRYSDIIDLIKYKKINVMTAVPGILEGLKKAVELREKPLHKLLGWQFMVVGVGGASLPKELEDWWRKRVLLLQGYGLTETSPLITTNLPFKKRKYSTGKPLKNVKIRIKDDEIQVKGPNVMREYYKKPEKTKEVFEDGWFKTGDLGEIKKGFLYLRGRTKDIIVTRAGLNVYPQDVEDELNRYVKESCVIEKNNNIHAVLSMEKGDPKKIIEEVNKRLEQYQKIASWNVWGGEFPKTPTGKIKRYEVKKKVKHTLFKHKSPLDTLLASSLKTHIKKNVPLTSLGMDSLKRMEILALIEEKYGVELNEKVLGEKTTPKELENWIKKRKNVSYYDFGLPKLNLIGKTLASLITHIFCRIDGNKTAFQGIIVANHTSALDVHVLTSCIKTKYAVAAIPHLFGMVIKNTYYKIISFLIKHFFNAYPFGYGVGFESSLRFTAHLLDEGFSIIIFPEGERTRDGKIQSFKEGIGLLAVNMDAEILPVKTEGLFRVLPYYRRFPRFGKVRVKIGKPFRLGKISYFKAAKLIEKKVKSL